MAGKKKKIICEVCGGSGQTSYFKGVSRFLLTTEECEICAGTGFQLISPGENGKNKEAGRSGKKNK